jgi:uridine kinase
MKKLCFIICGQPRSIDLVIDNINDKFKEYEISYYLCLTKNQNDNEYLNNIDINLLIKQTNNIKKLLLVESVYDNTFRNSLNYSKKIYDIIGIVENLYDLYLIIRTDLIIESIDFINNIDYDNDTIYFSSKKNNQYIKSLDDKVNDNIIITKQCGLLLKLRNIYNYLLKDNNYLELALYNYLSEQHINYRLIELNYKLVLSKCNVIAIAGDSGSGKSTLMKYLIPLLGDNNYIQLETDRYHKWERGNKNYEKFTHLNPEANYLEKMSEDVYNLKIGHDIYTVDYDHATGKFTQEEKIDSKDNIILCGLHTLYNEQTNKILNLKVYMDTDRELIKKWKIKRDVEERGYSLDKILKQIENREKDYDLYIKEQKNNADIIINFYEEDYKINCKLYIKIDNNIELLGKISKIYNILIRDNYIIINLCYNSDSNIYFKEICSIVNMILYN